MSLRAVIAYVVVLQLLSASLSVGQDSDDPISLMRERAFECQTLREVWEVSDSIRSHATTTESDAERADVIGLAGACLLRGAQNLGGTGAKARQELLRMETLGNQMLDEAAKLMTYGSPEWGKVRLLKASFCRDEAKLVELLQVEEPCLYSMPAQFTEMRLSLVDVLIRTRQVEAAFAVVENTLPAIIDRRVMESMDRRSLARTQFIQNLQHMAVQAISAIALSDLDAQRRHNMVSRIMSLNGSPQVSQHGKMGLERIELERFKGTKVVSEPSNRRFWLVANIVFISALVMVVGLRRLGQRLPK